MKHMKRSGIYQCSNYNCTFSPGVIEAYSYRWWKFVKVIKGQVVFNRYYFSRSTSKHQSKVRRLMSDLGIKIDREVSFKTGLQEVSSLKQLNAFQKAQDILNAERAERRRVERNTKARENRARLRLAQDTAIVTAAAHDSHLEQMRVLSIVRA